jgi:hypothetical protein
MNNMNAMNNMNMMNNMNIMNNMFNNNMNNNMMNNNMNMNFMNNMNMMNNMFNNMNMMNNMFNNNMMNNNNMNMMNNNNMNNMNMMNMNMMNLMNNNMNMMNMNLMNNSMNNMNNMNMNNFMNNSQNNNVGINFYQKSTEPTELIQRGNKTKIVEAYPGLQKSDRLNVVMIASSGLRLVMSTPPETPIRVHIRKYLEKLGLGEGVLEKDLVFLINATKIDVNSLDRIDTICHGIQTVITVIDVKNVIAA